MSETNQAFERLRRAVQIYSEFISDYRAGKGADSRHANTIELLQASGELADAYLREHLPDDDEAITYEWLREQGFPYIGQYDYEIAKCVNGSTALIRLCESVFIGNFWLKCKTRGELRRLLRALGVSDE